MHQAPILHAVLAVCVLLGACRAGDEGPWQPDWSIAGAETAVPSAAATRWIERFDGDRAWSQDAAGCHLRLDYDARGQSDGALAVRYHASGQEHGIVRKEVACDLRSATAVELACYAAGPGAVTIAWRGADGGWFQHDWQELAAGWQRQRWSLADIDSAAWPAAADAITRINILLRSDDDSWQLVLDELRIRGPEPVARHPRISGELRHQPPARTQLYQRQEWLVQAHVAAVATPPEPTVALDDALLGRLQIRTPTGEWEEVRGCLIADSGRHGHYAFRWTPRQVGRYHWRLGWPQDGGLRWQAQGALTVDAAIDPPAYAAFARIDPANPHRLADADDGPLWPIGMNLGWSGDPLPWLDRFAEHGGNLIRVWLSPWGWRLTDDHDLHRLDQHAAARIDDLFAAARERGIAIQLVCFYHGLFAGDWGRNPWNEANQGPCAEAEQFWVDRSARQLCRRWLDYLIARWGAEPNLFAWELVNEVDLALRYEDDDLIAWHAEMSDHLRRRDVHGHLITTSSSRANRLTGLWQLPTIDLIQRHSYHGSMPDRLAELAASRLHKPVFVSEFGRDWRPAGDQRDPDGRFLRAMLFSSACSQLAGSAMPWWWDTHIEANARWPLFRNLRTYLDLAPRAADLQPAHARWHRPNAPPVVVRCLLGADQAWVYLFDQHGILSTAGEPVGTPAIAAGQRLQLDGLADGSWHWRLIDPATGSELTSGTTRASGGRLHIPLPAITVDAAIFASRQETRPPTSRLLPPE